MLRKQPLRRIALLALGLTATSLVACSDKGGGDAGDPTPPPTTFTTSLNLDSDGDGILDVNDKFPQDPNEWADFDKDGVGNNTDAFPGNPKESLDSDGDKVGDNTDQFPNDPTESKDTDGDGVGDKSDAFPKDATESKDSDGDTVGDNVDQLPNDPANTIDSDGDGIGDQTDAFPDDAAEWLDSDRDNVGDNSDGFPNDAKETKDSDQDGVGDNGDDTPQGLVFATTFLNTMLIDPKVAAMLAEDNDNDGAIYPEDCDLSRKDVHPGANDYPDGQDLEVDFNCDWIADADLTHGLFVAPAVAGATDDDATSGSFEKPYKTVTAALARASDEAANGGKHTALYLAAGEYVLTQPIEIPTGVAVYGGYVAKGPRWRRAATSDSAAESVINAGTSHWVVLGGGTAKTAATLNQVRIVGGSDASEPLLNIVGPAALLEQSTVERLAGTDAVHVVTQDVGGTVVVEHVTITHAGNAEGTGVGFRAEALGNGQLDLRLSHVHVQVGDSDASSVGISAASRGKTPLKFSLRDSEITTGISDRSVGLAVGEDDSTSNTWKAGTVVLERNRITAGFVAYDFLHYSAGIRLWSVQHAVLRNNVVRGTTDLTQITVAIALSVVKSNLTLINNTFLDATRAASIISDKDLILDIRNNIFQANATDLSKKNVGKVELDIGGLPTAFTVRNNLFTAATDGTKYVDLVKYTEFAADGTLIPNSGSSTILKGSANIAGDLQTLNGLSMGTFADNRIGNPHLTDDGMLSADSSEAINRGLVVPAQSSESTDDATVDLDGQSRGQLYWDIGADEYLPL
ncbi:MAG: right-handed parallel beta-helix repeat-containing protein [Deltaproteobacteria bacterium]|nr:right-handed parallel beta-helix repeat-containing protein [Deltaproteobacteria bacterium]